MPRLRVIYNPTAHGEKVRQLLDFLNSRADRCDPYPTRHAGHARDLAHEAVRSGCQVIVAAGGDGTINEVVNGIGDDPEGFNRTALGLLPAGTTNVFAKELGIPGGLAPAWKVIEESRPRRIDLPCAHFQNRRGREEQRYFVQLAGAGFDARAIERVSWKLKKLAGPLAYVWAGLQAFREILPEVEVRGGPHTLRGQMVLVGNGRYFGGKFRFFPDADLADGRLDVCVIPRIDWRFLFGLLTRLRSPRLPDALGARSFQTTRLTLTSPSRVPLQLEGDCCGELPASLGILPGHLQVLAPEIKSGAGGVGIAS